MPGAVGQRLNLSWYTAARGQFLAAAPLRTGLRRRLGLPVHAGAHLCAYVGVTTGVACTSAVDPYGQHAQHCCNALRIARHHALRDAWRSVALLAGWHAAVEQYVPLEQ
eukprot:5006178-Amphidinium_carterae.1